MLYAKRAIIFRQIGGKVAYYRRLRGFTQQELADRAHISASVVGRLERGKYNDSISLSLLLEIADALEIDFCLLLSFNDEEKAMWWEPKS